MTTQNSDLVILKCLHLHSDVVTKERRGIYSTIIIHVGGNDLVEEIPEKAVKKMRQLLMIVREQFPYSEVVVSSVLPRYDL